MAQQTAVEWLAEKIYHEGLDDEFVKQAVEMEKKQHGSTWDKALDAYEERGHLYIRAWTDFDEYYNETYGK